MAGPMIRLVAFILILCASPAFGATYNWYFSDDAAGNAAGDDTTGDGSIGNPWKSLSKMNSMIASMTNGTDTANIYMDKGDTWTLTSDVGIRVGKSNVTITSYGTGANPIIDGNNAYPSNTGSFVVTIGNATYTSANISNVHISNLHIKDTWGGALTGGGGIQFSGTSKAPNYFTGNGSVKYCKIENTGKAAISIYGVINLSGSSNAIVVEGNEITAANQVDDYEGTGGWPQNISTLDNYTRGHECRYNRIYDTFGEGIGVNGFAVVEYNVISNTSAPALYIAMPSTTINSTWNTVVRHNVIFNQSPGAGVSINDEATAGTNTGCYIEVYGNIVIDGYYGIRIRNQAQTSNYGSIRVYNNTFIDCQTNISIGHSHTFNDLIFTNNASIISSDAASTSEHMGVFTSTSWTGWTVGPNYYYGESVSGAYIDTETGTTVFSNANDVYENSTHPLPTTSGWISLTTVPTFASLYPGATSGLVDQTETDSTIGAAYGLLLTTGTDLSTIGTASPTVVRVDQSDNGTDWEFGAIVRSDESPPDPPDPPPTEDYVLQQDLPSTKDADAGQPLGSANDRMEVAGRYVATAIDLRRVVVTVHSVTGSPDATYTAKIYTKTGDTASTDTPNAQTGSDSTNTVDATTLSADSEMVFNFAAITTSATGYWVVIVASEYDASNYISLRYDSTDTQRVMRRQSGGSWTNTDNSSALHIKTYTYEGVGGTGNDFSGNTDVMAVYRFENNLEDSQASEDLTGSGSPTYDSSTEIEGSYSLSLNGSSQYASRTDAALAAGFPLKSSGGATSFTVVGKARFDASLQDGYIWAKYNPTGDKRSVGMQLSHGGGDILRVYQNHTDGTSGNTQTFDHASALSAGVNYAWSYRYNNTAGTVNGLGAKAWEIRVFNLDTSTEVGSAATGTGNAAGIYLSDADLTIGARTGGVYHLGELDEIAFVDAVLSSDDIDLIFSDQYGYENAAVGVDDIVMIVDPDGTPSILDNPSVTITDSTRRYIGLELNREVNPTLNPEEAFLTITGPDSRVEYAYFHRYLETSSRYFMVFRYDPPAVAGDRTTDLSFPSVNALDCNSAVFEDSDANDLCDNKALPRTDIGGTGSVDIAIPKNPTINESAWWVADWDADPPATIVAYDTFYLTGADTISASADNLVFNLFASGTYNITLNGDNCTIYKRPWQTVNVTDNGTGNVVITLKPRRK
jgi:hypothetical protein